MTISAAKENLEKHEINKLPTEWIECLNVAIESLEALEKVKKQIENEVANECTSIYAPGLTYNLGLCRALEIINEYIAKMEDKE